VPEEGDIVNRLRLTSCLVGLAFLCIPGLASATEVLFDFNSLSAGVESNGGSDAIEQYMESLYLSDITVSAGAETRKNRVENRPFGMFLGNSDGATDRGNCPGGLNDAPCHNGPYDTFLINDWNEGYDAFSITFENVPITGFDVDWEIFPVTRNGAAADITILADEEEIFFSELVGADKELGDLGHFSYSFNSPVHTLEFVDWRDTPIGIDNLRVRRDIPVPGTGLLFITGLVALGLGRGSKRSRG